MLLLRTQLDKNCGRTEVMFHIILNSAVNWDKCSASSSSRFIACITLPDTAWISIEMDLRTRLKWKREKILHISFGVPNRTEFHSCTEIFQSSLISVERQSRRCSRHEIIWRNCCTGPLRLKIRKRWGWVITFKWVISVVVLTIIKMGTATRKRYVVKHNLITEVYLMTMWWKQLHVSACIGHHQVV